MINLSYPILYPISESEVRLCENNNLFKNPYSLKEKASDAVGIEIYVKKPILVLFSSFSSILNLDPIWKSLKEEFFWNDISSLMI